MSKPGAHQEYLDDNDKILRLGLIKQSSYKQVSPDAFRFNSREKKLSWKRISVYETSLTSDAQAIKMATNEKRRLIIKILVSDIKSLSELGNLPPNVRWDHEDNCLDGNGNKISGSPDGCEGHCGLEGIWSDAKEIRESIRVRISRLINKKGNFYIYEDDA